MKYIIWNILFYILSLVLTFIASMWLFIGGSIFGSWLLLVFGTMAFTSRFCAGKDIYEQ